MCQGRTWLDYMSLTLLQVLGMLHPFLYLLHFCWMMNFYQSLPLFQHYFEMSEMGSKSWCCQYWNTRQLEMKVDRVGVDTPPALSALDVP